MRCSLPACRQERREGAALCEWHLTGERPPREREFRPRGRQATRYEGRYILADGTPRRFVAYAFNRSDAAADVERQAREALGPAFAAALSYGVERA